MHMFIHDFLRIQYVCNYSYFFTCIYHTEELTCLAKSGNTITCYCLVWCKCINNKNTQVIKNKFECVYIILSIVILKNIFILLINLFLLEYTCIYTFLQRYLQL